MTMTIEDVDHNGRISGKVRTAFSGQIQDREFDDDERIIFDRVVSAITAIIVLDARAKHGPLLPYQAELLFVGFRL
ncbi:MAG: hypothetical protein WBL55_09035, partial [Xanthobacteraceae bacterium]